MRGRARSNLSNCSRDCFAAKAAARNDANKIMTLPSILFGLTIALLIGAFFHLLRGGSFGRLFLYFVLSISGFAAGHLLGQSQGWILFPVGPLDTGLAIIGSLVFLGLGDWISRIEIKPDDNSQV